LKDKGFEIRGDGTGGWELKLAGDSEWNIAYLNKTVAFKLVDSLEAAIAWINQYSSGHADCIVTESYQESRTLPWASIAPLPISTLHRDSPQSVPGTLCFGMFKKRTSPGLISLETLTTVKHIVQGNGRY